MDECFACLMAPVSTSLPTTRLVLVRHGETAWNRAQRLQGQLDIPLSERGHLQAQALAQRLRAWGGQVPLAAVVSSDLARAAQTAAPIAEVLGLPVLGDPGLRERHYGVFQGLDRQDLPQRYPELYARWQARDPTMNFETGESLAGFQARIDDTLHRLAQTYAGQTVIAVCHGGVLDAARRYALALPLAAPRDWSLFNASLNVLQHAAGSWTVPIWGDVAHLTSSEDDLEPIKIPASQPGGVSVPVL